MISEAQSNYLSLLRDSLHTWLDRLPQVSVIWRHQKGQRCGGNGIQSECIPVSPINKPLLLSGQLNGHTPFTWVSAILYTSFCLVVYHGILVRKVMISGVWLARRFVQGCISNTNHVNDALNSIAPINASLFVVCKHMEVL